LVSGTFHDVLGPTWANGYNDGSTVVGFTGPNTTGLVNASTVMCPLLATTEQTTTSGNVYFGTRTQPMTYYMVCDNDGRPQGSELAGYQNTCDWGGTGTFYGLMLLMEARIEFSGGSANTPSLEGAVFCGVPGSDGNLDNDLYLLQHGDIPAHGRSAERGLQPGRDRRRHEHVPHDAHHDHTDRAGIVAAALGELIV
jgi:hypothetical protein